MFKVTAVKLLIRAGTRYYTWKYR